MKPAAIIPFPAQRVYRSPELIEAFEKLALIEQYRASGDPLKEGIADIMGPYWEGERDRLIGGATAATVH